jgi:long-chain acyl-CoA synthetase
MPIDTTVHRLFANAKRRPDAPALFVKADGAWQKSTYGSYARDVRSAARTLIAWGLGKGSTVCILGFNRPEWVIMDLAAMAVGGAPAGIYTTSSPEEVGYIVGHAESRVVLVENEAQWRKIEKVRGELPKLEHVVLMRGAPAVDDPMVIGWDDFLSAGEKVADSEIDKILDSLEPDGLATLIYTSGTTGPPKGVMLSHRNLTFTADVARQMTGGTEDEVSLSYLPLSHIAEQMFTIHGPVSLGSTIYFAESIEKVPDNLKEVQPTLFFGVPRIWEKFHAAVSAKLADATGVKAAIVRWARGVGARASEARCRGEEPSGLLGLQYKLASKLFFSKLKPLVGLGRARVCVSGAAPIAKEVLEFFASLDIIVREVYGQSEDTGPTSFNVAGRTKLGSVGPALPGVEVKIAEDGEILVRGPNVFLGYYKDPAATAETLKDGWLCSGDLGAFDADGFLSITGRKKEIIITSGGKNITPKNIESALKNHPLVSEAVVIGDRRKYLTALVTLDPEAAARFAKERDLSADNPHERAEIRAEVQKAFDEVNATLARVETVKKFAILPRSFTIEDGELTPTLKVKRRVVNKNFAEQIEALYAGDSDA